MGANKKEILKKIREEAELLVIVENIKSSFDAIVEKKKRKYFVKILNNIDSLAKEEATSLRKIAYFFESYPFIIGEASNNGKLEDYVLFKRFSIPAGTYRTFASYINNETLMKKNSTYYYRIDGKKLRKAREKKGISLNQLSKELNLSKETLYRYEKEQIMARKENLELLEKFFNESLSKSAEKFETEKLTRIGNFEGAMIKSPFYCLLRDEDEKIIAGKEKSTPSILKKYVLTYESISSAFGANYFFISTKRLSVPYVLEKEVKELGFSEGLKKLIKKRLENF